MKLVKTVIIKWKECRLEYGEEHTKLGHKNRKTCMNLVKAEFTKWKESRLENSEGKDDVTRMVELQEKPYETSDDSNDKMDGSQVGEW